MSCGRGIRLFRGSTGGAARGFTLRRSRRPAGRQRRDRQIPPQLPLHGADEALGIQVRRSDRLGIHGDAHPRQVQLPRPGGQVVRVVGRETEEERQVQGGCQCTGYPVVHPRCRRRARHGLQVVQPLPRDRRFRHEAHPGARQLRCVAGRHQHRRPEFARAGHACRCGRGADRQNLPAGERHHLRR